MEIKIIAVGKLKEEFIKEGVEKYLKDIKKKHKITIIELNDEKTSENASEKEESQVKDREGREIFKKIRSQDFVICMDLAGKLLDTSTFKMELEKGLSNTRGDLVFVIGGSLGISEIVLERANSRICFSKMTFPHQLFRLILLEQIAKNL